MGGFDVTSHYSSLIPKSSGAVPVPVPMFSPLWVFLGVSSSIVVIQGGRSEDRLRSRRARLGSSIIIAWWVLSPSKGTNALHREQRHGKVLQPVERRALVCPPHLGAAGSIDIGDDLFGAAARLTQGLLVWLADLDPKVDCSGKLPFEAIDPAGGSGSSATNICSTFAHPCRATKVVTTVSKVTPCKGSRG